MSVIRLDIGTQTIGTQRATKLLNGQTVQDRLPPRTLDVALKNKSYESVLIYPKMDEIIDLGSVSSPSSGGGQTRRYLGHRSQLLLLKPAVEGDTLDDSAVLFFDVPIASYNVAGQEIVPNRSAVRVANIVDAVSELIGRAGDYPWYKLSSDVFSLTRFAKNPTLEFQIAYPKINLQDRTNNLLVEYPHLGSFLPLVDMGGQQSSILEENEIKNRIVEVIPSALVASIDEAFRDRLKDPSFNLSVYIPNDLVRIDRNLANNIRQEIEEYISKNGFESNISLYTDQNLSPSSPLTVDAYSALVPTWWLYNGDQDSRVMRQNKARAEEGRMELMIPLARFSGLSRDILDKVDEIAQNVRLDLVVEASPGAGKSTLINRSFAFDTLLGLFPHESMAIAHTLQKLRNNPIIYRNLYNVSNRVYQKGLDQTFVNELISGLDAAINHLSQNNSFVSESLVLEQAKNFINSAGSQDEKIARARLVAGLIQTGIFVNMVNQKVNGNLWSSINLFEFIKDQFYRSNMVGDLYGLLPSTIDDLVDGANRQLKEFSWALPNYIQYSLQFDPAMLFNIVQYKLFDRPKLLYSGANIDRIKEKIERGFDPSSNVPRQEWGPIDLTILQQTSMVQNASMTFARVAAQRNAEETYELLSLFGLGPYKDTLQTLIRTRHSSSFSPTRTMDSFFYRQSMISVQGLIPTAPSLASYALLSINRGKTDALQRELSDASDQKERKSLIAKLTEERASVMAASFLPFTWDRFLVERDYIDFKGERIVIKYDSSALLYDFIDKAVPQQYSEIDAANHMASNISHIVGRVDHHINTIRQEILNISGMIRLKSEGLIRLVVDALDKQYESAIQANPSIQNQASEDERIRVIFTRFLRLLAGGGSDGGVFKQIFPDGMEIDGKNAVTLRKDAASLLFEIRSLQHDMLEKIIQNLFPIYYMFLYARVENINEQNSSVREFADKYRINLVNLFTGSGMVPGSKERQRMASMAIAYLLASHQFTGYGQNEIHNAYNSAYDSLDGSSPEQITRLNLAPLNQLPSVPQQGSLPMVNGILGLVSDVLAGSLSLAIDGVDVSVRSQNQNSFFTRVPIVQQVNQQNNQQGGQQGGQQSAPPNPLNAFKLNIQGVFKINEPSTHAQIAMHMVGALSMMADTLYRQVVPMHDSRPLVEKMKRETQKYEKILTELRAQMTAMNLTRNTSFLLDIAEKDREYKLTSVALEGASDLLDFFGTYFELLSRPLSAFIGFYSPLFGGIGLPPALLADRLYYVSSTSGKRVHINASLVSTLNNGNPPSYWDIRKDSLARLPALFTIGPAHANTILETNSQNQGGGQDTFLSIVEKIVDSSKAILENKNKRKNLRIFLEINSGVYQTERERAAQARRQAQQQAQQQQQVQVQTQQEPAQLPDEEIDNRQVIVLFGGDTEAIEEYTDMTPVAGTDSVLSFSLRAYRYIVGVVSYADRMLFHNPLPLFYLTRRYNELIAEKLIYKAVENNQRAKTQYGFTDDDINTRKQQIDQELGQLNTEINNAISAIMAPLSVFDVTRMVTISDNNFDPRALYRRRFGLFYNFLDFPFLRGKEVNEQTKEEEDIIFPDKADVVKIMPVGGDENTKYSFLLLVPRSLSTPPTQGSVSSSEVSLVAVSYEDKQKQVNDFSAVRVRNRQGEILMRIKFSQASTAGEKRPFIINPTLKRRVEEASNDSLKDTYLFNTFSLISSVYEWELNQNHYLVELTAPSLPNFLFLLSRRPMYLMFDSLLETTGWKDGFNVGSDSLVFNLFFEVPFIDTIYDSSFLVVRTYNNHRFGVIATPFYTIMTNPLVPNLLSYYEPPMSNATYLLTTPISRVENVMDEAQDLPVIVSEIVRDVTGKVALNNIYGQQSTTAQKKLLNKIILSDLKNGRPRKIENILSSLDPAKRRYYDSVLKLLSRLTERAPTRNFTIMIGDSEQNVYMMIAGGSQKGVRFGRIEGLSRLRNTDDPRQANIVGTSYNTLFIPFVGNDSRISLIKEHIVRLELEAIQRGKRIHDIVFSQSVFADRVIPIGYAPIQDPITRVNKPTIVIEFSSDATSESADTPYNIILEIREVVNSGSGQQAVSVNSIIQTEIPSTLPPREIYSRIMTSLLTTLRRNTVLTATEGVEFIVRQKNTFSRNDQEEIIRAISSFTMFLSTQVSLKDQMYFERKDDNTFRQALEELNEQIMKSRTFSAGVESYEWLISWSMAIILLALNQNNRQTLKSMGIIPEEIVRVVEQRFANLNTGIDDPNSSVTSQIITFTNYEEFLTQLVISNVLNAIYYEAYMRNSQTPDQRYVDLMNAIETLIARLHVLNVEQTKGGEANYVFLGPSTGREHRFRNNRAVYDTRHNIASFSINKEAGWDFYTGLAHHQENPFAVLKSTFGQQTGYTSHGDPIGEFAGSLQGEAGTFQRITGYLMNMGNKVVRSTIGDGHSQAWKARQAAYAIIAAAIADGTPNVDRKALSRPRAGTPIPPDSFQSGRLISKRVISDRTYESIVPLATKISTYRMLTKTKPSQNIMNVMKESAKIFVESQIIPIIDYDGFYLITEEITEDGYVNRYRILPTDQLKRSPLPINQGQRFLNPILFKNNFIRGRNGSYTGEFVLEVGNQTIRDRLFVSDQTQQIIRTHVFSFVNQHIDRIVDIMYKYHSGNEQDLELAKREMDTTFPVGGSSFFDEHLKKLVKWMIIVNAFKFTSNVLSQSEKEWFRDKIVDALMDVLVPDGLRSLSKDDSKAISLEEETLFSRMFSFSDENDEMELGVSTIDITYDPIDSVVEWIGKMVPRGRATEQDVLRVLFDERGRFMDFVKDRIYDKGGLYELPLLNMHDDIYSYYGTFITDGPSPLVDIRFHNEDRESPDVRIAFGAPINALCLLPSVQGYLEYIVTNVLNSQVGSRKLLISWELGGIFSPFISLIEDQNTKNINVSLHQNNIKRVLDYAFRNGVGGGKAEPNTAVSVQTILGLLMFHLYQNDLAAKNYDLNDDDVKQIIKDVNLEIQLFLQYSYDVMLSDMLSDTINYTSILSSWLWKTAEKTQQAMAKLGKQSKLSDFLVTHYTEISRNHRLRGESSVSKQLPNFLKDMLGVLMLYDMIGTFLMVFPMASLVSRMPIITNYSMTPSFIRPSIEGLIRAGSLADPTNHTGDFDGDTVYVKEPTELVKTDTNGNVVINRDFIELAKRVDTEKLITNPMEIGKTRLFNYLVMPDFNSGSQLFYLFTFGGLFRKDDPNQQTTTIKNVDLTDPNSEVSVDINIGGNSDTISVVVNGTTILSNAELITNEGAVHYNGIIPVDEQGKRIEFSTIRRLELGDPSTIKEKNNTTVPSVPKAIIDAILAAKQKSDVVDESNYLLSFIPESRKNSPIDMFDFYSAIVKIKYNDNVYYTTLSHLWVYEMLVAHVSPRTKRYITERFIGENLFASRKENIQDLTRDNLIKVLDYLSNPADRDKEKKIEAVRSFLRMANQNFNLPRNASPETNDPENVVKMNEFEIFDSTKQIYDTEATKMEGEVKKAIFDPDRDDVGVVQTITEVLRRSIMFAMSHLFSIEQGEESLRGFRVINISNIAAPFEILYSRPDQAPNTTFTLFRNGLMHYQKLKELAGPLSLGQNGSHLAKRSLTYLSQLMAYNVVVEETVVDQNGVSQPVKKHYIFVPLDFSYKQEEKNYIPGVLIDIEELLKVIGGYPIIQEQADGATGDGDDGSGAGSAPTSESNVLILERVLQMQTRELNPYLANVARVSKEVMDHIIAKHVLDILKSSNTIRSVILREEQETLENGETVKKLVYHKDINRDLTTPAMLDSNDEASENLLYSIYDPIDVLAAHKPFTAARGVQYQTTRALLEIAKNILGDGARLLLPVTMGILRYNDPIMSSMAVAKRFFVLLYRLSHTKQGSRIYTNLHRDLIETVLSIDPNALATDEREFLIELIKMKRRTIPTPGGVDLKSVLSVDGYDRNGIEIINGHSIEMKVPLTADIIVTNDLIKPIKIKYRYEEIETSPSDRQNYDLQRNVGYESNARASEPPIVVVEGDCGVSKQANKKRQAVRFTIPHIRVNYDQNNQLVLEQIEEETIKAQIKKVLERMLNLKVNREVKIIYHVRSQANFVDEYNNALTAVEAALQNNSLSINGDDYSYGGGYQIDGKIFKGLNLNSRQVQKFFEELSINLQVNPQWADNIFIRETEASDVVDLVVLKLPDRASFGTTTQPVQPTQQAGQQAQQQVQQQTQQAGNILAIDRLIGIKSYLFAPPGEYSSVDIYTIQFPNNTNEGYIERDMIDAIADGILDTIKKSASRQKVSGVRGGMGVTIEIYSRNPSTCLYSEERTKDGLAKVCQGCASKGKKPGDLEEANGGPAQAMIDARKVPPQQENLDIEDEETAPIDPLLLGKFQTNSEIGGLHMRYNKFVEREGDRLVKPYYLRIRQQAQKLLQIGRFSPSPYYISPVFMFRPRPFYPMTSFASITTVTIDPPILQGLNPIITPSNPVTLDSTDGKLEIENKIKKQINKPLSLDLSLISSSVYRGEDEQIDLYLSRYIQSSGTKPTFYASKIYVDNIEMLARVLTGSQIKAFDLILEKTVLALKTELRKQNPSFDEFRKTLEDQLKEIKTIDTSRQPISYVEESILNAVYNSLLDMATKIFNQTLLLKSKGKPWESVIDKLFGNDQQGETKIRKVLTKMIVQHILFPSIEVRIGDKVVDKVVELKSVPFTFVFENERDQERFNKAIGKMISVAGINQVKISEIVIDEQSVNSRFDTWITTLTSSFRDLEPYGSVMKNNKAASLAVLISDVVPILMLPRELMEFAEKHAFKITTMFSPISGSTSLRNERTNEYSAVSPVTTSSVISSFMYWTTGLMKEIENAAIDLSNNNNNNQELNNIEALLDKMISINHLDPINLSQAQQQPQQQQQQQQPSIRLDDKYALYLMSMADRFSVLVPHEYLIRGSLDYLGWVIHLQRELYMRQIHQPTKGNSTQAQAAASSYVVLSSLLSAYPTSHDDKMKILEKIMGISIASPWGIVYQHDGTEMVIPIKHEASSYQKYFEIPYFHTLPLVSAIQTQEQKTGIRFRIIKQDRAAIVPQPPYINK